MERTRRLRHRYNRLGGDYVFVRNRIPCVKFRKTSFVQVFTFFFETSLLSRSGDRESCLADAMKCFTDSVSDCLRQIVTTETGGTAGTADPYLPQATLGVPDAI